MLLLYRYYLLFCSDRWGFLTKHNNGLDNGSDKKHGFENLSMKNSRFVNYSTTCMINWNEKIIPKRIDKQTIKAPTDNSNRFNKLSYLTMIIITVSRNILKNIIQNPFKNV